MKIVHEKRRDYACDLCNMSFGETGDLRKHVKAVHMKIKEHQCPHCEMAFSRPAHMRSHVGTIHNTKQQL